MTTVVAKEASAALANPVKTAQKAAVLAVGVFLIIGIARRVPVVGPKVDQAVRWSLG